jgi:hypothetical protein
MRYTDLGRYDQDLIIWKKRHKEINATTGEDVGYGRIPDEILVPYSCRDVWAPMRAYPIQHKYMKAEGTLEYYLKYRLPFVTDGFVDMALAGLPMHMGFLDELRDLLQHTEERLLDQFRQELESDAYRTVLLHLAKLVDKRYFSQLHQQIVAMATTKTPHESFLELCRWVQERLAPSRVLDIPPLQSVVQHFRHCRYKKFGPGEGFNIRSGPQMINWLYGVKGLTPIKTTKKDGIQMAWEKIATFPEELQASFSPSVDRSCIEVFARENPKLATVLEINMVGNQIKNYLRPPDENGVERGVHKWVCSDGNKKKEALHSARPRSGMEAGSLIQGPVASGALPLAPADYQQCLYSHVGEDG